MRWTAFIFCIRRVNWLLFTVIVCNYYILIHTQQSFNVWGHIFARFSVLFSYKRKGLLRNSIVTARFPLYSLFRHLFSVVRTYISKLIASQPIDNSSIRFHNKRRQLHFVLGVQRYKCALGNYHLFGTKAPKQDSAVNCEPSPRNCIVWKSAPIDTTHYQWRI